MHFSPGLAQPKIGQETAEIQAFGTIAKLPNGLSEKVCKDSVERLNQILADTMTLRDYVQEDRYLAGRRSPRFINCICSLIRHYR